MWRTITSKLVLVLMSSFRMTASKLRTADSQNSHLRVVATTNAGQNLQFTQRPLISELSGSDWRPLYPGEQGHQVMILLPGFSTSFWMRAYGRCYSTIAAWKAKARADEDEIQKAMSTLAPADGLAIARFRGPAQMPFWSRLAIADYRKRGFRVREIAEAFQCSERTVANVISQTRFLSPARHLTEYQRKPPSMRTKISSMAPNLRRGRVQ